MKTNKVILLLTLCVLFFSHSDTWAIQARELSIDITPANRGEIQSGRKEIFTDFLSFVKNRSVEEISLREVLQLTLEKNAMIEAGLLKVKAASARLRTTKYKNNPKISIKISGQNTPELLSTNWSSGIGSYLSTSNEQHMTLSTNFQKKTDNGITFFASLQKSISVSNAYAIQSRGDGLEELLKGDSIKSAALSAGVSIPIMRDWGKINLLDIKRTKLLVQKRIDERMNTVFALLEEAGIIYWRLVEINENIKTLREAVTLSRTLLGETVSRVELGLLSHTDIQEARSRIAVGETKLLSEYVKLMEIEDQLKFILDRNQSEKGFHPTEKPVIHKENFNVEALLEALLKNNPEIERLRTAMRSSRLDLLESMNKDKPDLDLDFQYTITCYGQTDPECMRIATENEVQGFQIGLIWSNSPFDKSPQRAIQKRRLEGQELELKFHSKKLQLTSKLKTILRKQRFGLNEEITAKVTLELSERLLDTEIEKLKLGQSSSYAVSQAQQKHTEAKLNLTKVRVQNEENFISLLSVTGKILDYYELRLNL